MTHDKPLTSLAEQDATENNQILQYFTTRRFQEPEYEDKNSFDEFLLVFNEYCIDLNQFKG